MPHAVAAVRSVKKSQPISRLDDLAEKFDEIEHQKFGGGGFDEAPGRMEKVEQALGLGELDHYTASPPPPRG